MVVHVTILTKLNSLGNDQRKIHSHHGINHEINQCLAENNAENTAIMLAYRYEFAVSVEFSRCSCCHSYAQQHRLLQDKNQYSRKNGISVSHGGVEYRNLIKGEWLGGYLIVSIRKAASLSKSECPN